MSVLQTFAQRLTKLHEESGLSQDVAVAEIRRKTGEAIHQTTFSTWLRGKKEPTLSNLAALAAMYNVSIDYLAGLTADDTPALALRSSLDESALPGPILGAAQLLAQLSDVSRDRIMADIEERTRNEQRWRQLETLVKRMDTDGSLMLRVNNRLDDLAGDRARKTIGEFTRQ